MRDLEKADQGASAPLLRQPVNPSFGRKQMQAIIDAESKRDYEIRSRKEVVALLRQISEKKQLIRLMTKGEADVCITSLLNVDPDNGTIILDRSVSREQDLRIASAARVSCETSLDQIRILFDLDGLHETVFEDGAALGANLPSSLIRLQRREFYRIATPVSNPAIATIALPGEQEGETARFPLVDISCGGLAILDQKRLLGSTIGRGFSACRIDLPNAGIVTASLQIRYALDMTLPNNKTNCRLGCQFGDMSRADLATVQRYITKLERERNARLAGLA
jgi:c-di-GMP-binding flagellar brake protein YcgR